jgi:hypothetical protein
MTELQQVIQQVKSDIARGYVFVHMKGPQLETLLAGLEEQQREIESLKTSKDGVIKFACPKCNQQSRASEWDHKTAVKYGHENITSIVELDADDCWFVCPKCDFETEYDTLSKEESK